QDRLQGEGVGTPEVDVGLLETCCTQIDQQGLLLYITMRSCSLVFAAYDFHSGSEAPVSKINVCLCLQKIQAHGEHDAACVNEIADARIVANGGIALSPP